MSDYEYILPEIINSLKSTSGEAFFNALTTQLHKHIGADYTLIARLQSDGLTAVTISLVAKGNIADNFEYLLKDTPCEEVSNNLVCVYPCDVCKLFPKDELLIEMQVEGYVGTPLYSSKGKVEGVMVALYEREIRDTDFIVTLFELFSGRVSAEIERSDKEKELTKLAETLENKIYTRTKDLELTVQDLKSTQNKLIQSEKMAALGKLTASISHEINNPTNFSYAAAFMMDKEVENIKHFLTILAGGENADPKIIRSFDKEFVRLSELIQTTKEGTCRIKEIVASLAGYSHNGEPNKERIRISNLVKSTIFMVKTQYSNVIFETEFNDDPTFLCFPSKLNQVFMNLIVNACQAIIVKNNNYNEGQLQFEGRLSIAIQMLDDNLIITFNDNGCGMNEATKERIFETFYTTKNSQSGTGLGMAVSLEVIQLHKGTMEVNSYEGNGTEIIIKLPIIEN